MLTKICVVTNMYPPHHLGGYELAAQDAVRRWRAYGHEVCVLTSDVRFSHATGTDEDGVMRDLAFYWRDGEIVEPAMRERIAMERRNTQVFERVLDDFKPDVISAWHMGAMSLSMLTTAVRRDIALVCVIYDQWLVYGPKVDAWTRMFVKRPWARRFAERVTEGPSTVDIAGPRSAVCFMSDWLRKRSEELSTIELPAHRAIVYGGIDHETFTLGGRTIAPWTGRLLVAGRVEERKGVHIAVDAMEELSEATLDVVGPAEDDGYAAALRERVESGPLRERVRFYGPASRAELADAYRSADAFIFPVTWDEPFGMTPLEAMACGAPVIGTGTGGSDEFLLHEVNCLRVPRGDAHAIVDAVRRLASDDALRHRLINNGLLTAAQFSNDRFLDELEDWHEAAVGGFSGALPEARRPLRETLQT